MAADTLTRAVRNPGRLVLGPTRTTGAFPYGGVALGQHKDGEVVWHTEYLQVRDPATGRIVEINRRGNEFPEIYALIEGTVWDEVLLTTLFTRATRSAQLPATTTTPDTRVEGSNVALSLVAWPPLLFAATNPTQKSVYFTRPIPTLSLRQALAISNEKHAGLPMRFIPTPTLEQATIPDWQIARLENIQL